MILITGCAHGATTYISKVMTLAGVDIGHESVGRNGVAAWQLTCHSDKETLPVAVDVTNVKVMRKLKKMGRLRTALISDLFKKSNIVLHQTREPLATISSVMTINKKFFWQAIAENLSITSGSPLVKATKYWLYNNLRAEQCSSYTYQVEVLEKEIPILARKMRYPLDVAVLKKISTEENTRKDLRRYRQVSWEDIQREVPNIYEDVKALACKYGYSYAN